MMDDYIPSGGFFTPRRPSFRMTPGPHPVNPNNYVGNRTSGYNNNTPSSSNQSSHRRACSYHNNNVTPSFVDDHRRLHSHGGGSAGVLNSHQNQRNYYTDRYGRTHYDHPLPVYYGNNGYSRFQTGQGYRQHQHGSYGPFQHGVFTPPPNNAVRGKGDKRLVSPEKERNEKIEESKEDQESSDSPRSSGDSGCSTSNTGGTFNGDGELNERSSVPSGDDTRRDVEVDQGPQMMHSTFDNQSQFMHQQQQGDVQYLYNYNSPDVRARRRHCPTQIPIQAIHYNDEMNHSGNWNVRKDVIPEEVMKGFLPPWFEHEPPRGYESGDFQQQNHGYMEPGIGHQAQMGTPDQQQPLQHCPPPFMHYPCPQPQAEQIHPLHNIHPVVLQCVGNPALMYNNTPYKLIESARYGFSQFQKDFGDNQLVEQVQKENYCDESVAAGQPLHAEVYEQNARLVKTLDEQKEDFGGAVGFDMFQPVQQHIEFSNVRFMIDDRDFIDKRKVLSLLRMGDGGKEYKLFEDQMDPFRGVLSKVYDCNFTDSHDPMEICCTKILPRTLQKWPLEFIGTKWEGLKKHIVNFNGGFGSCGAIVDGGRVGDDGKADYGELGNYGVRALAKVFTSCQGGADYALGCLTFIGMNVDKVVKDLENPEPVLQKFAGPLADRNQSQDSRWIEVHQGFNEYDIPYDVDGNPTDFGTYLWTLRHRIKRETFKEFSFELLMYIFYTFTGDALQLLAAQEANRRGWRFHKIFQIWMTPWVSDGYTVPGMNDHGEWVSGGYRYFHYGEWKFCNGEFKINDSLLETAPPQVEDGLWE